MASKLFLAETSTLKDSRLSVRDLNFNTADEFKGQLSPVRDKLNVTSTPSVV